MDKSRLVRIAGVVAVLILIGGCAAAPQEEFTPVSSVAPVSSRSTSTAAPGHALLFQAV